jgi:hypothetical protein
MPPLIPGINAPITGVDVQTAAIAALQTNPLLTGLFSSGTVPTAMPTILTDDPTTIDQATNISLALAFLGEDDTTASLGGSGVGTRRIDFYMAGLVYVFAANKQPGQAQLLAQMTGNLRAALMQIRQDPSPNPVQKWYDLSFYKKPATVYQNAGGFRRSITFIQFSARFRTL